ncbi:hypothetical protein OROGR_000100 [Orobanche gracilis]
MVEDQRETTRHHHEHPPPPPMPYGTFQGVANHPPTTTICLPQPVAPPGVSGAPPFPQYYTHGYQAVPEYIFILLQKEDLYGSVASRAVALGLAGFLFIIGFFLAAIPWYVAAFLLLCSRIDPREKPVSRIRGFHYCSAVLASVAVIFGLMRID